MGTGAGRTNGSGAWASWGCGRSPPSCTTATVRRHTELTAPDFVQKFVAFATRVAERYPWLDAYTPINEPLTTARFCGLYGLWYPHARDHQVFLRILVNQITAIRLAMRAIREINPRAQLIQTEDLAKAHSTPSLAYHARHENARRWLSSIS